MDDEKFLSSMSVHVFASFLDPLFKKLDFLNAPSQQVFHEAIKEKKQQVGGTDDTDAVECPVGKKTSKLQTLLGRTARNPVQ